jgi:hypothetical protein
MLILIKTCSAAASPLTLSTEVDPSKELLDD